MVLIGELTSSLLVRRAAGEARPGPMKRSRSLQRNRCSSAPRSSGKATSRKGSSRLNQNRTKCLSAIRPRRRAERSVPTLHEKQRHQDGRRQRSSHGDPVGLVHSPRQSARLLLLRPRQVGVTILLQLGCRTRLLLLLLLLRTIWRKPRETRLNEATGEN